MLGRGIPLLVMALFLGPSVAAVGLDDVPVYASEGGHFWAGLLVEGVEPVNLARFPISVDQCHRNIRFDLHYEPSGFVVGEGSPSASIAFQFLVELIDSDGAQVANQTVTSPGFGKFLATAPASGDYTVDLTMLVGADATWNLTVKGQNVLRHAPTEWEPACAMIRISEVEANPDGTDAGNEWLELHNEEFSEVDVSGWNITATGGTPGTLILPAGKTIPADGYLLVNFTEGQFLDNVNETAVLTNLWDIEVDRTSILNDAADDSRTNQWVELPDFSYGWEFKTGTPDAAN